MSEKKRYRQTRLVQLYTSAVESLREAKRLTVWSQKMEYEQEEDTAEYDFLNEDILRQVQSSILFAAFFAEGLINDYLFFKVPGKVYDDIERLNVLVKWQLAPEWGCSMSRLDRGLEPLQGLVEIVETRNALVHPKSYSKSCWHKPPSTKKGKSHLRDQTIAEAERATETLKKLVEYLTDGDEAYARQEEMVVLRQLPDFRRCWRSDLVIDWAGAEIVKVESDEGSDA